VRTAAALDDPADLSVIGGGPAGLAAAAMGAELGLDTVLLDEQSSPGGQIYRAIAETPRRAPAFLGAEYWQGARLIEAFRRSGARYYPGAMVWNIARDLQVAVSMGGVSQLTKARQVVIATGALERPFAIPGWTLPGVMTVGGAQNLLKSAGMVAEGRAVLAGSGPLIWLLAAQYLRAGASIVAILDTTPSINWFRALARLPEFAGSQYFTKGRSLLKEVAGRVPVLRGVSELRASGDERLTEVIFRISSGAEQRMAADYLLLHQGVVPNVNLAMATGCRHHWDVQQLCFHAVLDEWMESTIGGVAIAGDGASITGAEAAVHLGRLAALGAAFRLGRIDRKRRDRAAAASRAGLRHARRGRKFLDILYRPSDLFRLPNGNTIVCRCEEVTADQIKQAIALGCLGPNQLKAYTRCGMGPCQGRLCGLSVTEIVARQRQISPAQAGYYRLRPPVKPVALAELAMLATADPDAESILRT
jgi:NADPH-dependent 2,4-dienoyl-CoA reductase/sulfur reductase-like enzyme